MTFVHSFGFEFSPGIIGFGPHGVSAILFSTSMPRIRCPKAVYLPSRLAAVPCMMKNCDPPELGAAECAIERTPGTCLWELNSSGMV